MMRWEIFNEIGGFDQRLAVAFNDTDLCLRIGKLGLKVLNDPYAVLYCCDVASGSADHRLVDYPADTATFCGLWKDLIACGDPFYNPLLALTGIDHTVDNRPVIGPGARVVSVSPPGRAPTHDEVLGRHDTSGPAPSVATVTHLPLQPRERHGTFRVVYISGEPDTPQSIYRVMRPMTVAKKLNVSVSVIQVYEIPRRIGDIEDADVIIIFRAPWDEHISLAVDAARRQNVKIVFDVDDLLFDPALARHEIIDGIRMHYPTEDAAREQFSRMRSTMLAADLCLATTHELAEHMRRARKPTIVLPNAFDHAALETARLAVRRRARVSKDGVFRIGTQVDRARISVILRSALMP